MRELLATAEPLELYATAEAAARNADILSGYSVQLVSEKVAASLSETVTPQGLIAVASLLDTDLERALGGTPQLVAVLVEPRDPGNVGTIIRLADAAGADAVVLVGDSVDPHNGKCVRASVGSHFHLPIAVAPSPAAAFQSLRDRGLRQIATSAGGARTLDALLDDATLSRPHAWVYGNESRGLGAEVLSHCDDVVAIPIYGRAESLNLASAAAITLYASARSQRLR